MIYRAGSAGTELRWMILGLLGMLSAASLQPGATGLPAPAVRIAALINRMRQAHGLAPVAVSPSLTMVAEAHVRDAEAAGSVPRSGATCNLHSWAGLFGSPLCYRSDPASAEAMAHKPGELTRGHYGAPAYEIAYWTGAQAIPDSIVAGWLASPAHAAVMLEQGMWRAAHWQAMGIADDGHFAFVWFGAAPDPAGRL